MANVGTWRAARILGCAFALGAAGLPAHAQQRGTLPARTAPGVAAADQQNPNYVAVALNLRRSQLYRQKDTGGVASLYTADATYIELMPVLQVLKGRDQIKGHLDELLDASALAISPTVLSAEMNPDGTIAVSGDYHGGFRRGRANHGHFVQTLRKEDGTWRIASHVFARPHLSPPPSRIAIRATDRRAPRPVAERLVMADTPIPLAPPPAAVVPSFFSSRAASPWCGILAAHHGGQARR